MDNDQAQTAPQPNTSGAGQLPQGYTVDSTPQQQSQTAGLPPGFTVDSAPQSGPDTGESFGSALGHEAGGILTGIGKGVAGTLEGTDDWARKHLPAFFTNSNLGFGAPADLEKEKSERQTQGTPEAVGSGLETIGEFFLGDEALKGMSLAERLTHTAKAMSVLEKFPKVAQALKLGINVGKAGAELGPEERAAIKQSPVLARLVGAGYSAIRAGAVQTAQTAAKTGDVGQALNSGLSMAGGSALAGGTLGTLGGLLSKGGDAASTIGELGDSAKTAPTGAEVNNQFGTLTTEATNDTTATAQDAVTQAQNTLDSSSQTIANSGVSAPDNQALIDAAQKAAKSTKASLGSQFVTAGNSLIKLAGKTTVPLEDSPLQKAAKDLTTSGTDEAKPLDQAFSKNRPGSPKANERLDYLLNPYKDAEEAAAKANAKLAPGDTGVPVDKPPVHLGMQELLDRRKQLNELLRNTGFQTDEQRADQGIYHTLIKGVDDTIEQLVNKTGNPEAIDTVKSMNADYAKGSRLFENPDVAALLEGRVSGNDLIKKLTSGVTGKDDIQAVRSALGDEAFQKMADGGLQRMAADSVDKQTGEFSLRNFLTKWNGLNSEARNEAFKDSLTAGTLQKAVNDAQTANSAMPELTKNLKEATDTVSRLIGNGDVGTLLKDPERVQSLAASLGPDGMSTLGTSILQNQLREAATNSAGVVGTPDTGKVLKFIASLKDSPEVVQSLFRPTPKASQAYDKLLGQLHNVQSVKNAVKFGVIAPTLAAGIHLGPVPAVVASLLTAGEVGTQAGRAILEKIANSPTMWKSLSNVNKATSNPAAKAVGMSLRYGAGKFVGNLTKQDVYSGAQDALGGK